MATYPPAYAKEDHPKLESAKGSFARRRFHVQGNPDTVSAWRETVRNSGLSHAEAAKRIGIGETSLRDYLVGARPVPLVVVLATNTVVMIERIRQIIGSLPKDQHAVAVGKLRALHPSLALPVRVKPHKPVRKPKRVVKAKVKLPGRKGRGIAMPRVYPAEPEGPMERHARVIASLRPDRRAGAINEARLRAAMASYGTEEVPELGDELPPSKPPIITRLL